MIGEHISHFFIIRRLGSGGMGDVYEAQDTRLPRSVAIKFLKSTLSEDADALKRFKREARLASSLNHPNICTILDVEEANGQAFIAMELLHGQSLKARLSAEPLTLAEIIDIAKQVADALAAAHDQGIVHRDIAPGNVFVTNSGLVKLLDFGLAKHAPHLSGDEQTTDELTAAGVVAGTVHYMSPEQLTAAEVDYRSDLFSLGVLLYQMATGARPFDVAPRNALICAIESEPHVPVQDRAPHVPAEFGRIIDKLLAKRPEDRYQSARALRIDLDEMQVAPTARRHTTIARRRRPAVIAIGGAAIVGLVSAAWMALGSAATPVETTLIRYANLIDESPASGVTFTPDGRTLLYSGSAESRERIMMRRLDESTPHAIANVETGELPFVSPDGRQLSFRTRDDTLPTVTLEGADAPRVARWRSWFAPKGWRYGNGAWIGQKAIIGDAGIRGLLWRDPHGVALVPLTQPDSTQGETRHAAPLILPGERAVVFTVSKHGGFPGILIGSLAIAPIDLRRSTAAPHVLLGIEARRAIAFVDGRLLYTSADGRAIMAVPLDLERQRTSGPPVAVLFDSTGDLETGALADNGNLLYLRRPRANTAVTVDANGVARPGLANPEGPFMYPRFSPDGKRFAVQVSSALGEDIWLYDIASGTPTRLTTSGHALHPTWTPDGRRVLYMVQGTRGLMSQSADSGVVAEKVPGTDGAFAPSVAPNGQWVLFQQKAEKRWDVWSASLTGDGARHKMMTEPFSNYMPVVSPDGRRLAYVMSMAPGRWQVFVRPFPGPGPAVQISDSGGGSEPAWSPDGRRIYYRKKGLLMTATVNTQRFAVTSRKVLFEDAFDATMPHRNYDVSPDGNLFLMISEATAGKPEAVVILNWVSKLREQLAVKR